MTTIAHIADLHLSPLFRQEHSEKLLRLLEHIVMQGTDHLVVTGDITANADPRDFSLAREAFGRFGFLDGRKLSMVIGNHDIFGGVHVAEDLLTFPQRLRSTDFHKKVQTFRDHFPEAFDGVILGSKDSPFPFAKLLDGVALFGVNSVAKYSGVKNPLGSNGSIGEHQAKQLRRLLESDLFENKRKIVLVHHHFAKADPLPSFGLQGVWGVIERQTMKLRGKKALLSMFRSTGVDLVLHGHVHVMAAYKRHKVRILNAGGTLHGEGGEALRYNRISVSEKGVRWKKVSFPANPESLEGVPELLSDAA